MPSLQYTLTVEQLHVVSRAAREIKARFPHPLDGVAALALLLVEAPAATRADRFTGHFGASPDATITSAIALDGAPPPARAVHPPGTFWTRSDGFLETDPPPPPTHFIAYGVEGPLACVGLTKFPDGIEYSDQWTPNAVLRIFTRIHGDIWDDVNRIAVEPPNRTCFCSSRGVL